MGRKATKKFAARGQLKKTIEARHKARQIKKKFNNRKTPRSDKGKERERVVSEDESDAEGPGEVKKGSKGCANIFFMPGDPINMRTWYSAKRMTVDSFLNGDFMNESGEEDIDDAGEVSRLPFV